MFGAYRFIITGIGIALAAATIGQAARTEVDLSGPGWKLWYDKDAKWQADELFLPPVDLAKIPTNPPTGGWEALDSAPARVAICGRMVLPLYDTR